MYVTVFNSRHDKIAFPRRYSRDMELLATTVYPFVRDNAEFYASWAISEGDQLMFPFTCAQEACMCRDNTAWYTIKR